MTFRERIKKALKQVSPSSSLSKSSTKGSDKNLERWPSNVYKPGEAMPRPKYRAPVKKEHKEKLESFSWGEAWRRRSFMSEYSPMGTRMPSRRASFISRKSFGGKSSRSRRNSVGGGTIGTPSGRASFEGDAEGTERPRHAARATTLSAEIEADGDDDITNVGISRVQSREDKPRKPVYSRRQTAEYRPRAAPAATPPNPAAAAAPVTAPVAPVHQFAPDHKPFTEEDLALAIKRSHLVVPAQG